MMKPLVFSFAALLLNASLFGQTPRGMSVKVFILAGQSNMEGYGRIKIDPKRDNNGAGTLERLAKDDAAKDRFKRLLKPDGSWASRDDVRIWFLTRQGPLAPGYGARPEFIGPELAFGQVMGDYYEQPVLLIKAAWGGKSLAVDFRPPSAGKVPYSLGGKQQEQLEREPEIMGKFYRQMLVHVRDVLGDLKTQVPALAGRQCELAGFLWHQGWNDRINDAFNREYESNLAHLIRDLRKDLAAPNLPVVVAESGMNGLGETHPRALSLMKAQAAVAEYPEFKGNVAFVATRSFYRPAEASPSNQGYHWNQNAETYFLIGEGMGQAMIGLLEKRPVAAGGYRRSVIEGWTTHVSNRLLTEQPQATERALALLGEQLRQITKVVPAGPLAEVRKVPLWLSPPYAGFGPTAEYHPDAGWLRKHERNPEMAKAVEFTNVAIFEKECRRMPVFVLHELAHAYHDRVLGFEQAEIAAAYREAVASKSYDMVQRHDGRRERSYAMTNAKEYFAECSEAFFGRNDFYPFDRAELKQHDPTMHALLARLWQVEPQDSN